MSSIKQLIKEFRELREKALQGKWEYHDWGDCFALFNHNVASVGKVHKWIGHTDEVPKTNAEFIIHSANKITKLLDAMDVLVEAVEKVEAHFCACSLDDEIIPQVEARKALQLAEEKVSGSLKEVKNTKGDNHENI